MARANRTIRVIIKMMSTVHRAVRRAGEMHRRRLRRLVMAVVHDVSRKDAEEAPVIRLSVEDQQRFAELLLDPPPLSPAMERALEAHRRMVRYSEP